ncbi:hypothetical protein KSF_046680 [Reticulibacter mediterranei]|uniref:60 kDa chaperonin n=1 Tax=Reticulibacter mediterranei TaxID=2778369 RepID=A0A8J3IPP5_9CHLR|nr:TCP-1/cpn60 chaperonin family protein [Reticulibacter mediterranei]GHO94620.1 hypothetical protein KSF_046680 [Reticulibacter mediterranei]
MLVRRGIEHGAEAVVNFVRSQAIPVESQKEIAQIASISAADEQIGQLIAEVMQKLGKDGVITVEESRGTDFGTDYVEGMQFDRGYISPYFVTNSERMEAAIDNPYILITDRKISAVPNLLYRKTHVEDALSATRAAVEEGLVAGGGVTLLNKRSPSVRQFGPAR